MGKYDRTDGQENSISDIRRYFEEGAAQPLSGGEFVEFWKSCTEEDRLEFKQVDLAQMR